MKKDKKESFKKRIPFVILAIAIIFFMYNNSKINEETKISINNDFYTSINENIINNNELESDEEYWSLLFSKTQDTIDDKVDGIVKEIISKKDLHEKDSVEYKICKLYESIINWKLDNCDKIIEKIEEDNIKIVNLIGNNGIINKKEFKIMSQKY